MASRLRIGLAAVALVVLIAVGVGCGGSTSSTDTTTTVAQNVPSPGLPYLLYISDRDGDEEIYGVRADGKRTVQITRDEKGIEEARVSPNWQWLYLLDDEYRLGLVSTDGTREIGAPSECASSAVFSDDGRLVATSEDTDCLVVDGIRQPQVRLFDTSKHRFRTLTHGQPVSFSPGGGLLGVLDLRVRAYTETIRGLNFVDTTSGSVLGAIDRRGLSGFSEVGWSPSGKWFAYLAGRQLFAVDVMGGSWEPRSVLRDPRLDEESWYDMPVTWLDDETLSLLLESEEDDEPELSVVSRDGDKTVLADDVRGYPDPVWTPDGTRVAYAVQRNANRVEVVSAAAAGGDGRVLFHARSVDDFAWADDDRLVVEYEEEGRTVIALVDLDGRAEDVFRTYGYPMFEGRSPDGRFLSLGPKLPAAEGSTAGGNAIGILSLAVGSVARIPVAGNVELIGWADSSVREAGAPVAVPSPELASPNHLRSSGEIAEISASGDGVAAIVESSKLDCRHVVAWKAGSSRVVRFTEPRPCSGDEEELVGIALERTRLTWTGESWGNYAYLTDNSADMRHPEAGVRSFGGDEGYESGVERPKPERATRAGVSARVERGAIVLVRASDGRTLRLSAPGPVVDAELENAGLFYAYNTGGAMKGHIVFLPFAELFD